MKITSYFCDLCGSAIPTELVDDVKGLNIRVDLDHGAYESFVFQHACLNCRNSVRTVLVEWRDKHKKATQTGGAHTPKPVGWMPRSVSCVIGHASREADPRSIASLTRHNAKWQVRQAT